MSDEREVPSDVTLPDEEAARNEAAPDVAPNVPAPDPASAPKPVTPLETVIEQADPTPIREPGAPVVALAQPPTTTPRRRSVLVVTRGERMDVASWVPTDELETAPPSRTTAVVNRSGLPYPVIVALLALAVAVGFAAWYTREPPPPAEPLAPTIADLSAVHGGVFVGDDDVFRTRRLHDGAAVRTDDEGKARIRLDSVTTVVLDRSTSISVTPTGIAVESGRVFVRAAPGTLTEIDAGAATALANGVDVAVARLENDQSTVYASNGELTVRAAAGETLVPQGETAHISPGAVEVKPERGFDDWTGGLTAPWSNSSGPPRATIGSLWGTSAVGAGEPGSPLTIRSHEVRATVFGEYARTEVRSTFFNAGSETVYGDFRMALPPGAIIGGFSTERSGNRQSGHLTVADRQSFNPQPNTDTLEWAGEGWVRGWLPNISTGATVTVVIVYTEWLTPRMRPQRSNPVVQYRYPMVGADEPPVIGEFFAVVETAPAKPISIATGLSGRIDGTEVEVRSSDYRPRADLVVDVEIPPFASAVRIYPADALDDDPSGQTVVVRTEVPLTEERKSRLGVSLAVVLDTSTSIEPALLDAGKALVGALLRDLGPRDQIVVFGADQKTAPIGPKDMGPVDAARREATLAALAKVEPAGATDLGLSLVTAADALPIEDDTAMVLYIGDGWATMGDRNVDEVRARLSRRARGVPALGAVSLGPSANRFMLQALVDGGPLLELTDSDEAGELSIALLTSALRPKHAAVSLDLGPTVERVYPRTSRSVGIGETMTTVGRVRGKLPKDITLSWREGGESKVETLAVTEIEPVVKDDVRRRWAEMRVEQIIVTGRGREAAVDVAQRAGLLTPWTAFVVGGSQSYLPTPLRTRILDLSSGVEHVFTPALTTPSLRPGTITSNIDALRMGPVDEGLEQAVRMAARRAIDEAHGAIRACRDSRAALRPELGGQLNMNLTVTDAGTADKIRVTSPNFSDEPLFRCVEVVLSAIQFPTAGERITVQITHTFELPQPVSSLRGQKCSSTSTLPLPLRRGIWLERLHRMPPTAALVDAKQTCELKTWTDRRTFLELILSDVSSAPQRLQIARELALLGENDAANFLRSETVKRASTAQELASIRWTLLGDEILPQKDFDKAYLAAKTDDERLAAVRRFLGLAPHHPILNRRLLWLLSATNKPEALREEVRRLRNDPFADAGLLAEASTALRRLGDEAAALRTLGEVAERAPNDPWARAFLGDRLLAEGNYEEAIRAYTALATLMPQSQAAQLRLALSYAGSKRVDLARRIFSSVAQGGGRKADPGLSALAGLLARKLLSDSLVGDDVSPENQQLLAEALVELPPTHGATWLLVRVPVAPANFALELHRGPKDAKEVRAPAYALVELGLYAFRVDQGDETPQSLHVRRAVPGKSPEPDFQVDVVAISPEPSDGGAHKLIASTAAVPLNGDTLQLDLSEGGWRETTAPRKPTPAAAP